jgi:enoyl-CoA hydratase
MTSDDGEVRVSFERDGQVATILLDREAKLNALTMSMLDQLVTACEQVEASTARVVMVRTAGSRVFCVGADITRFAELDSVTMWSDWIARGHRAFDRLAALRQPTIAVIDGIALGGGLELALACDLRVISGNARVGLPEAGLGTVPGWGGTSRLVEALGRARAMELMLTRRQLSGVQAEAWGLATRFAPEEYIDMAAEALANEVLGSAPLAAQFIKQLAAAGSDGASTQVLESLAGGFTSTTSDLREGITAFREKRSPKFTGA